MSDNTAEVERMTSLPKRDAHTASLIEAARGVPLDAELEAQLSDAHMQQTAAVREMGSSFAKALKEVDYAVDHSIRLDSIDKFRGMDRDPTVTLSGPEAVAYLALSEASRMALEAQNAHAEAKAALHKAIEVLCRAMVPGPANDVPERKPGSGRGDE
jgi:hypothetical protein